MMSVASLAPIGIFDSGIGGLSVLKEIRKLLPNEDLIYLADQARVPYGPRPAAEIREFSHQMTRFLLQQGSKMIVVACNTASAAALTELRACYPDVPIVGMEPAVKPGAGQTKIGKIGILATEGTFGSQRYAGLMARYGQGVVAFEDPCPGLVEQIEAGLLDDYETEEILRRAIEPMLDQGVDTLVLGCTHYPFVLPLIEQIAGLDVTIIDPAPAVARQVRRVLKKRSLLNEQSGAGAITAYTTAGQEALSEVITRLLGEYPTFTKILQ